MDEQAVAVDQLMALGGMAEGVDKAFLAHDALDEVIVGVAGLHAVFARLVFGGAALLVVLIEAMRLEHRLSDLRDALRLEDAPVGT